MDGHRAVTYGTYALATAILVVAALFSGLLDVVPVPGALARFVASLFPVGGLPLTQLVFMGLPLALALALLGRAVLGQSPAEVVLGAFAVPCLLVSAWALYSYLFTSPGIYWGGLFAIVAGTLLAVVVAADAVLEHVALRPSR